MMLPRLSTAESDEHTTRRTVSLASGIKGVGHRLVLLVVTASAMGAGACVPFDPAKSAFNAQRPEVRRKIDAVDLKPCATAEGPTGPGRATLFFAGTGLVEHVVMEWAPYSGHPAGKCVADRLRTVKADPFEGPSQKLTVLFVVPEFSQGAAQ